MSDRKLTGATRYRINRHGELVLQVQERWLHTYCVTGMVDSEWCSEWRDARVEDLTVRSRQAVKASQ